MAHTLDYQGHTSGATNPVALNLIIGSGVTLVVLYIVVAGSTQRVGGTPTFDNTYNFTQIDQVRIATETNCEMWYLARAFTAKTSTIRVPNSGLLTLYLGGSSYKAGSGKTSAFDVSNGNTGVSANPSLNVTPTVNGDAIVNVLGDGCNTKPTAYSQTLLYSIDEGNYSDNAQYALQAIAQQITFSWTVASDDWCMIVGAFKEVVSSIQKLLSVQTINIVSLNKNILGYAGEIEGFLMAYLTYPGKRASMFMDSHDIAHPVNIIPDGFTKTMDVDEHWEKRLARDLNGKLWYVYNLSYWKDSVWYYRIGYAYSTDNGLTWTWLDGSNYLVVSDDVATDYCWPSIAVDSANHPHVVWRNYDTGKIRYSKYMTSWSPAIDISTESAKDPYIVVDKNDCLHVVWTTGTKIQHRKYDGVWEDITTIYDGGTDSQAKPALAVDINNIVHIVWQKFRAIVHSQYDGTWSELEYVANPGGSPAWNPAIVIGRHDNIVHVTFQFEPPSSYSCIYYRRRVDGVWESSVIIADDENYAYINKNPSMSIDKNDVIYVAFARNYTLCYVYNDGTWSSVIDCNVSPDYGAMHPSLMWAMFPLPFDVKRLFVIMINLITLIKNIITSVIHRCMSFNQFQRNSRHVN